MRSVHCTQNEISTRWVEGRVIIYEVLTASTAQTKRLFHLAPLLHGSSGSRFSVDDPVSYTCYFGSNGANSSTRPPKMPTDKTAELVETTES